MEKRFLTVTTKAAADKKQVESLFVPVNGRTLSRVKWCGGKYRETVIGRTLFVPEYVHAIWAERRKDRDGPYCALYALCEDR
jgi:hypothetical protein